MSVPFEQFVPKEDEIVGNLVRRGHDFKLEELKANERYSFALGKLLKKSRVNSEFFCSCTLCKCQATPRESYCSQELLKGKSGYSEKIRGTIGGYADLKCLTQHKEFTELLNERDLDFLIEECEMKVEDQNKSRRFYAYKKFVRWCFGTLEFRERCELPSCVRNLIWTRWSSEETTGFTHNME